MGPVVLNMSEARAKPRLAVIISGLRDRFILKYLRDRVVKPTVQNGFLVDLYISLVDMGNNQPWEYETKCGVRDPNTASLSLDDFRIYLSNELGSAGGTLVVFEAPRKSEELGKFPAETAATIQRMAWYTPYHSPCGRNVLRRYKTAEHLFGKARAYEEKTGFQYGYIMWARDDSYFEKPFNLSVFAEDAGARWTLYSRDCNRAGGINDKLLLMGRKASEWLFEGLYTQFWKADVGLSGPHMYDRNWVGDAEMYMARFVQKRGVRLVKVPQASLPSLEAQFEQQGKTAALCVKPTAGTNECLGERQLPLASGEPQKCGVCRFGMGMQQR